MTVQQMFNALPILQRLMELKLPIKKAYKVYNLAKTINEKREFFINEEKKLIEKFNAQVSENGMLKFEKMEDQVNFLQEHEEMMNYEELDLEVLELDFDDLGDTEFSPIEVMQLEGVISFKQRSAGNRILNLVLGSCYLDCCGNILGCHNLIKEKKNGLAEKLDKLEFYNSNNFDHEEIVMWDNYKKKFVGTGISLSQLNEALGIK